MIEQTLDLISRLEIKIEKNKEETLLLQDAVRFMQAFYRHQEALLRKSVRELDEELDRAAESSTS